MAGKARYSHLKPSERQIEFLEEQMRQLAERNPSYKTESTDYRALFEYLAVQKITDLDEDQVFESLTPTDSAKTGMAEELLDAYLINNTGNQIELKLFQFKFTEKYNGGISTKELYAFVDRMNRVFLKGALQDETTLEAFKKVREALEAERNANPHARTRVQCYYIVNGQNVSPTDNRKLQEIQSAFTHDRQTHGFTFETYGGVEIYDLCEFGRVRIGREILELEYNYEEESYLHHRIGENSNDSPEQMVVGFVNVNQLIRLVERYSSNQLFEKNVRLFLGSRRGVNRSIIETVTTNRSPWFGFMNNGVSITAESIHVDKPPSKKKVRMQLDNMQIINGCQTVSALYHAKHSKDLKDRFQGNCSVMVRVYQVKPSSKAFLESLIVATNTQNRIRPENLLSNDKIQVTLQEIYQDYKIGYIRKEGEKFPKSKYNEVFTKEQAGLAYLGVVEGHCSRLRNSLSRREFFHEGNHYFRVFNLLGEKDDSDLGRLPNDFIPDKNSNRRALEILAARSLVTAFRDRIDDIDDKQKRGSLRKGTYYLARIAYLKKKDDIHRQVEISANQRKKSDQALEVIKIANAAGSGTFDEACSIFLKTLKKYLKDNGGNEDAALKNTAFANAIDGAAQA